MQKLPGVASSAYAPENESHAGVVSYRVGTSSIVASIRREEAYKQMFNACEGHYRIVGETEDRNNFAAYSNNGMTVGGMIGRHYIQFECSGKLPAPPIVNP